MDTRLEQAVQAAAIRSKSTIKNLLPRKTGNLQDNAFKIKYVRDGIELYIDETIAPYVKYPNVKRIIDEVWPIILNRFAQDIAVAINGRVE